MPPLIKGLRFTTQQAAAEASYTKKIKTECASHYPARLHATTQVPLTAANVSKTSQRNHIVSLRRACSHELGIDSSTQPTYHRTLSSPRVARSQSKVRCLAP